MKIIIIGIVSFILGMSTAGVVGLKILAYGGQSVAAAEIQMATTTLQLIDSKQLDVAVSKLCSILPIALNNKADMDSSWFATEFNYGTNINGENIEAQATSLLKQHGICQHD
ncbi:hypothetical protein [Shewanella ulleungensis]|jgi:hypothetical protein|uniref:Uncharacterized protein n=1 Tax=Shewanella ulleungensis TaxID=2282699 RepID=A0ABQ2QY57_9GAMM|nr:hypothetical protein [Shewanella ulleungensis]MCL1151535.1 hypothetical protein [Shewanella ulleungensis]GGQ01371.1 hypothetical protein GCM10009410_38760 [Shewanella ulleungensis]